MTLADAKEGQLLTIENMREREIGWQAFRFGIEGGAKVHIQKNISGGPVIIVKNQLEIAIGRELAQNIEVSVINETKKL